MVPLWEFGIQGGLLDSHACLTFVTGEEADHSSIFKVVAVALSQWATGTLNQPLLRSLAGHVIQPDDPSPFTKPHISNGYAHCMQQKDVVAGLYIQVMHPLIEHVQNLL